MDVQLIKATIADAKNMLEIQRKSFAPLYEKYQDIESAYNETLDRMTSHIQNKDYYKILYNGIHVGCIWVEIEPEIYRIQRIFILPEYQCQGIGQEALKKVEQIYNNAKYWALDCPEDLMINRHCYEKAGYHLTGVKEIVNNKLSLVYYEKKVQVRKNGSLPFHIFIREFRNEDDQAIALIWNEVIDEGESFFWKDRFPIELIKEVLQKQKAIYCAELNGEVIGFYILHDNYPGRGSHISNALYAVKKEFRGHGIGKMLGEHSISAAKSLGYQAMQFNSVVSTNVAPIHLWESLGFNRVGKIEHGFVKDNGKVADLYIYYKSFI